MRQGLRSRSKPSKVSDSFQKLYFVIGQSSKHFWLAINCWFGMSLSCAWTGGIAFAAWPPHQAVQQLNRLGLPCQRCVPSLADRRSVSICNSSQVYTKNPFIPRFQLNVLYGCFHTPFLEEAFDPQMAMTFHPFRLFMSPLRLGQAPSGHFTAQARASNPMSLTGKYGSCPKRVGRPLQVPGVRPHKAMTPAKHWSKLLQIFISSATSTNCILLAGELFAFEPACGSAAWHRNWPMGPDLDPEIKFRFT